MEEFDPIARIEYFLEAVLNGDPAPFEPFARAEFYLAYLCGSAVTLPTPQSRVDFYLAYKCGEDVEIPDPIERIDFYLAKWCGYDCETPDPIHPIEYYLNALANSGELKTVTGNPISVSDALAKPAESLVIEILPYQSGSGDPSPDNVRPITGWTGVNVQRCGKNLLDKATLSQASAYKNLANGYKYTDAIHLTPNTSYSLTPTSLTSLGVSDYYVLYINPDASDPDYLVITNPTLKYIVQAGTPKEIQFTTGATGTIRFGVIVSGYGIKESALDAFMSIDYQLELGSPATAYEPYTGTTYSIDWTDEAGTVYGGSLDVTTGVLTVDRAMVIFDGSDDETWNISTAWGKTNTAVFCSTGISGAYYPDWTDYRGMMTNLFLNATRNYIYNNDVECCGFSGTAVTSPSPTVRINKSRANTVDAFRTFLGSNNLQFCYDLATPLVIQLTPTEIQMLLGNNVIWNDVGDMVLEYLADGPADDIDALNILLNNRYVNNGEPDEATDKEALEILLGGNTR